MWEYTDKVMDHFLNPRNVGVIEDADGKGDVGSLACGDALTLTFKLDENGRIADAKFKTFGCASAVASSSVLTEIIKGLTLEEAANVTNKDIAEKLGGLPDQKMHCSVMGQEALEAAIQNYYDKTKTTAPEKEGKVVCTCFGITDTEIRKVVEDNKLNSVEQVTNYCKAGGGCGRCKGDIEKILSEVRGDWIDRAKKKEQPPKRKKLTNIQKIRLVQETISDQIRPALRADGGDIDLIDVEGNKVIVAFRGMCAKCKMADLTMRDVVQAKLREFVSEDLVVEEEKDGEN
ncbi:NifU-like protein [Anaerohalosphaera lusitana]|uniref:Nitrogen fixation protein NifU n=1 Tax=Anaerohalosphaera lusitana TaxID=1936003 RepID=A0A1U9NPC8_9BACT|nr:Fe-S cluster assembly protein NifU [Anaerohalosphaera lusitana]AQT69594.1 NifU-like protein [Anaerohalosphaera lusitana]